MKSEIQLFTHTVLIVDDEQVNREMLGNILQDQYDILYAIDGKQALEILEREGENISLVLLDLLMPNMSGGEVLKQMNRNGMIKNIPVIVLTSDKSSEIVSLKTGAADFLTKPYDSSEVILARVKHSIELFENTKIIKATGFDSLTRLYTGDFFLQYAALIDRKYPNSEMDSIVINFSKFHLLNELKGRSFGNEVLLAISQGIKNSLKKLNGIASRVNADTFYIYANHTDNLKYYLVNIKKELRELLKEPEMRFRLGYFVDKDHEFSVQKRFDYAIQACNSIRNQANKEIAVYDKSLADKDKIDAMLLGCFEEALNKQQFKVFYQPKFSIKGSKPVLCSAEALVRWEHPTLGFVNPDFFIPLFEENGLITRLDRYVWEEVAKQIARWKRQLGKTIPVSVNVSRVDIQDPTMSDFIAEILERNKVKPKEYMLEVTESAYTEDANKIIQIVHKLRSLGHKIEMDDFGSGYSSLNMINKMPIDALKMDKGFIQNIKNGNKEMQLVEIVLQIAKTLDVPVIAEGVETEEEYKLLKNAGCDIIQGFYFSKPIPPEEILKFIE